MRASVRLFCLVGLFFSATALPARAQVSEADIVRPAPPKLDEFETDANADGVPDGWYNLRDAKLMREGGASGPHFLRFSCDKPGRPARLSRAFGVDGSKYEAIVVGLWLRLDQVHAGERVGEEPAMMVDFLGPKLYQVSRGTMGPWNARTFAGHTGWTHVAKRMSVPPSTLDAILSLGLLGGTGVLDVDGLSVELVPRGGVETTNLVRNPDLELGDPEPVGWVLDNGARRTSPGNQSNAGLELARSSARALTGLVLPVEPFSDLDIRVMAAGKGLRGGGGAHLTVFFLDERGAPLRSPDANVRAITWSGSFDWREFRASVPVARGAVRAVVQVEKGDSVGTVRVDDVTVTASPDPSAATWTPYHVTESTEGWLPIAASPKIEPKSALDFSFLVPGTAGARGGVVVKDGRLAFAKGGRARFFGVQLLPPMAFLEPAKADALADRLARSGVNLVRLGDLDTPLGPDRSLFDDTRDDTKVLDANALARLDHLVAALKARGIYVAIELSGARRFRSEDGVSMPGALPAGGGPASLIDPKLKALSTDAAKALLNHVNPETGLALKHEPALAWVTLAGEVSLFDLIDNPLALPGDHAATYKALSAATAGDRKRFWQNVEAARRREEADALRKAGLKAPVAGTSHWRREKEFNEAQGADGLDLVDDRIFWRGPSPWMNPDLRSMLWNVEGELLVDSARKRRVDKPYVLGQWCDFTQGIWSSPFEAAEQLLAARVASANDWDGIVRRGLFVHPDLWGHSAPGTAGGEDIFQIPEVANAQPQVFALWPHAASLILRTRDPAPGSKPKRPSVPGWEPDHGRLVIETPYTEGVAGAPGGNAMNLDHLDLELESEYGVLVGSSATAEPLATTNRLLITAIARVNPTGFAYADPWKRETGDPGRPPLLQEPVIAKVVWKRNGPVKAYALDNTGARLNPMKVIASAGGAQLVIEGTVPALHWEMVVE